MSSSSVEPQRQQEQQQAKGPVLVGKSGRKICCACPDTKRERDECVVTNGQDLCQDKIEAHKRCLRDDGFDA